MMLHETRGRIRSRGTEQLRDTVDETRTQKRSERRMNNDIVVDMVDEFTRLLQRVSITAIGTFIGAGLSEWVNYMGNLGLLVNPIKSRLYTNRNERSGQKCFRS